MQYTKSIRRLAAGVSAIALLGAATPAAAQSAQEELRMLRDQMQQMQQRMQELESNMETTEKEVEEVKSNAAPSVFPDKNVRLELAGRINQGILFADNGAEDRVFIVDNDNSGSRFSFTGEADYNEWTSGVYLEASFEVNTTDEISFDDQDVVGTNAGEDDFLSLRDAEWYIENPNFGRIAIGHSDTASDGASEADLSGTGLIAESDVDDTAGGLEFSSDSAGFESIEEVDDFFVNLDGGRTQRIRYDTPSFAGFGVAVALRQDSEIRPDVGITYGGELAGWEAEAAAAWRPDEDSDTFHGSASVLAPFGINVTLAGGVESLDDDQGNVDDPNFFFGKLGYRADFFEFGDTRFSVDYFLGHNNADFAAPDGELPEATSIGGGVVQKINPLSTELYLGVRNYDVEDLYDGANQIDDPDNLITVLSGARVRF